MRWDEFAASAPELAALGHEAFEEQHLSVLGTLRRDGWPRLSPCEIYFVEGELMLGMMRNSVKAGDLLRDDRITVVNGQAERIPRRGDFKIYGRASEVTDARLRDRYGETIYAAIEWRPEEPFPLFAVDIVSVSYISFADDRRAMRWSVQGGFQALRHPDG